MYYKNVPSEWTTKPDNKGFKYLCLNASDVASIETVHESLFIKNLTSCNVLNHEMRDLVGLFF